MRLAFAVAALLVAAPAFAGPPSKAPESTSGKDAKIRELLRLTGADQVGTNMLAQMKAQLPPDQYARLAQVIHPDELVDLLVPIYAKHFGDADVEGLLAFYRSPVGRKVVSEMPGIAAESAAAGQNYARDRVKQLQSARSDVPPAQP